jgi:HAD superfamily hydrolase (TIGR01549 family)
MRHSLRDRGVVLDIGDTLFEVTPVRRVAIRAVLDRLQLGESAGALQEAVGAAFRDFDEEASSVQFPNFLFGLPVTNLERCLSKRLGLSQVESKLFASTYREFVRQNIRPNGQIINAVTALKQLGAKVGILSNGTAIEMEDAARLCGVMQLCDVLFTSEEIGAEKPSAHVFLEIERMLQLPGESLVMVGDDFDADVCGALDAGWAAIWIDGDARFDSGRVTHLSRERLSELDRLVVELLSGGAHEGVD